eukprot:2312018-Pleurochrysis_carterae.AAC.1
MRRSQCNKRPRQPSADKALPSLLNCWCCAMSRLLHLGDNVSEEVQSAIESGELPLVPLVQK